VLARAIAAKMSTTIGQSVVVDNRPGAGTTIAGDIVAKAPPDGYTIWLQDITSHAINASLYPKLPYDSIKDFTPIALFASTPLMLVTSAAGPLKSLADVLAAGRAQPGSISYASAGNGTMQHIAGALMESLARAQATHVPYKGSGQALIGLMGGDVDVLIMAVPASAPQVQSGKVRALAVLSDKRAIALPNVPTTKEAGYDGLEVPIWYGILTTTGTPKDIVARLHTELVKALTSAELKERLTAAGIEPMNSTPEQFAAFIRSENTRFAKVIKDAGIKPE